MGKCYASQLVKTALSQVGYHEKASNSQLDSNTANAGSGNWNKYARDFDEKWPKWYNGRKNGYDWCDIFVDWNFLTAFGYDDALRLLCQPERSAGAGCKWSMGYFKSAGRFGMTPRIGAQIFFGNDHSDPDHTGVVTRFDSSRVYTVEGNTANDMVEERSYPINSSWIAGYGYPAYDDEPASSTPSPTPAGKKTIDELAKEVLDGKWGNGDDRRKALKAAGYDSSAVQDKVNELVKARDSKPTASPAPAKTSGSVLDAATKKDGSVTSGRRLVTTAPLNVRTGAGTDKTILTTLPQGTGVVWYGFYSVRDGVKWYVIIGNGYTGFVSSEYLA